MTKIDHNFIGTHIIHGDVLHILPTFPAGLFGGIITDPPYSSGAADQNARQRSTGAKYSNAKPSNLLPDFEGDSKDQRSWTHWMAEWLIEARRVCAPGAPICLFIDWRQLPSMTDALQWAGWIWRGVLAWDKLPAAKKFKRWVTSEVLPNIRKHGAYATDDVLDDIESDPELAFELFRKLQADRGKIVTLEACVKRLAPKADFFDNVLQSDNAMPVTLIAKDYGMSAMAFNNLLYHMGVQYKLGSTWVLYQKYAKQGYTRSRTYYTSSGLATVHTAWTQKGRLFLFELLAYYDIYPVDMREQACYA